MKFLFYATGTRTVNSEGLKADFFDPGHMRAKMWLDETYWG